MRIGRTEKLTPNMGAVELFVIYDFRDAFAKLDRCLASAKSEESVRRLTRLENALYQYRNEWSI